MLEQLLPRKAGLQLIFVKPNLDRIAGQVLIGKQLLHQFTYTWFVFAVVTEEDIKLGVGHELLFGAMLY